MIHYAKSFQENVAGTLNARFQLDENNEPIWHEDDNGFFCFIELSLDSPNKRSIDKVIYELHQSYIDPVRRSRNSAANFLEEITSYGDFKVTVKIQMHKQRYIQQAWLSDLLEEGHRGDMNESIRDAIEVIKAN